MRKFFSAPGALAWTLAAVMSVALLGAPSARAAVTTASANAISAQLPAGVSLRSATIAETATALGKAVAANPSAAVSLTETALAAKKPRKGKLSCASVSSLVQAAMQAAPQSANDVLQMALSEHPGCADELNALVANPTPNAPDGFVDPTQQYGGFGVGFGPGFPGAPGFSGSPASGGIALPPGAVTATLNI